jgi:hypothetical protein
VQRRWLRLKSRALASTRRESRKYGETIAQLGNSPKH